MFLSDFSCTVLQICQQAKKGESITEVIVILSGNGRHPGRALAELLHKK